MPRVCSYMQGEHAPSGTGFTYLLTSVTFDRDCSALQIINQQGSIIIEAERKADEIRGRSHATVTLN